MTTAISSVLVANRGEIALRIISTLHARGIEAIAVYTDADAGSPHVLAADLSVRIGAGPVADSYLSGPAILAAAKASGAMAIHPGYGFLSENADFAQSVTEAGLIWIGPPSSAIAAMGDKAQAKQIMRAADVPLVPGYDGPDQSPDTLLHEAQSIGWPVMIKAACGGGGRGMRLVSSAAGFSMALDRARAEAMSAFGDDRVILEKAVTGARHVEFQVFADAHGGVVHLGERDCSIQRRHQKVIEEAPAAGLDPELRAMMGRAAVAAARAVDYVGAGTVEFLVASGNFYFLEMNTRLQVEHPVTEMVTGLDLVSLQIDMAEGRALDPSLADLAPRGHAIEARLYAEDPLQGFLPATGRIAAVTWPGEARVDAGVTRGLAISDFYDPLLAKIIVHGADRADACARMHRALSETSVLGITTNRDYLLSLLSTPAIRSAPPDTTVLTDMPPLAAPGSAELAAALFTRHEALTQRQAEATQVLPELLGWSSAGQLGNSVSLRASGQTVTGKIVQKPGQVTVSIGEDVFTFCGGRMDGRQLGILDRAFCDDGFWISTQDRIICLGELPLIASDNRAGGGNIQAPMHGRIAAIPVAVGDRITKGQVVVILEAMKMQHELRSPFPGHVTAIPGTAGEQVQSGALLMQLTPENEGE